METTSILDNDDFLAHKSSPDYYKLKLENDRVRVLEFKLPVGAVDNWHWHPSETFYVIKGGTLKIHLRDEKPMIVKVKEGNTMYHDKWEHKVENAGDTDIFIVIVELKV